LSAGVAPRGEVHFPVIEHEQPISELAAEKIKLLREAQRLDKRIVVSSGDEAIALSCGLTRITELMKRGELSSYLDGSLRRIFTASMYDYLVRQVIKSNPIEGGEAKAHAFLGTRPQAKAKAKGKVA
jgi:hypothetical protein